LRSGRLVRVLSDFPAPGVPFSLVYPSRRHLAPRTRIVMDFIWEQIRQLQAELATSADGAQASRTTHPAGASPREKPARASLSRVRNGAGINTLQS
jgi:hypothetical protein